MRFICLILLPLSLFSQSNWQPLFNGQNLDGWQKLNGHAEYRAENGEIVGISAKDTQNTFLATEIKYSDFIFECEVKISNLLNSGIQFRSNSLPEYMDGRVHGYQAEIDPSPRAYSGGIYDEARRGWIYPLTENKEGRKAFKIDDWNHYRIEAIGPEIRIWINGVNTANIVDESSLTGFIALQVHGIGSEEQEGKEVRWRNLKIMTENLEAERKALQPNAKEENFIPNSLTKWEKEKGWQLLWDGETLNGWENSFWKIKEDMLMADGEGDMVTNEKFSSFELKLEFKLESETDASGGIIYLSENEKCTGFEYHIEREKEMASLYQLIPAENLSEPMRLPANCWRWGEGWQTARIVVKGNKIEHWFNGYKMLSFNRNTQTFKALLKATGMSFLEACINADEGHIALRNYGGGIVYRSIKIRKFD